MERVKTALINHYRRDPIAFYFEMIGMFFTVAGSLLMALTAKDPNLAFVYPLFFVGASTGLVAYYRLQMIWSIVLTSYFVVINTVGFIIVIW